MALTMSKLWVIMALRYLHTERKSKRKLKEGHPMRRPRRSLSSTSLIRSYNVVSVLQTLYREGATYDLVGIGN